MRDDLPCYKFGDTPLAARRLELLSDALEASTRAFLAPMPHHDHPVWSWTSVRPRSVADHRRDLGALAESTVTDPVVWATPSRVRTRRSGGRRRLSGAPTIPSTHREALRPG